MSKYGVFFGPYFPVFGLNTGKYGPEKTPYLDTFHAVPVSKINFFSSKFLHHIIGFSSQVFGSFSAKSAINKIADGGTNFVPISVPSICLKVFPQIRKCF